LTLNEFVFYLLPLVTITTMVPRMHKLRLCGMIVRAAQTKQVGARAQVVLCCTDHATDGLHDLHQDMKFPAEMNSNCNIHNYTRCRLRKIDTSRVVCRPNRQVHWSIGLGDQCCIGIGNAIEACIVGKV